MKKTINGKEKEDSEILEKSKIDTIKDLLFGENISLYEKEFNSIKHTILSKKEELDELIETTRKELEHNIDSLSTDLNIRITELEDKFNAASEDLDSKKVDKKLLGDLFIKLGSKLSN